MKPGQQAEYFQKSELNKKKTCLSIVPSLMSSLTKSISIIKIKAYQSSQSKLK